MGPTERFTVLMGADETAIEVEEAALLIAAHFRPGLIVDEELRRIDSVAAGCADASFESLRRHLFDDLGFIGNSGDYYDADNSFLDRVLVTRKGIPITLSVLVIAVGRRLGLSIEGIGMPGHFLVRDVASGEYLDSFDGGVVLDAEGCRALHRRLQGGPEFDSRWLDPVGPRSIVRRMLNNLVSIAMAERDRTSLVTAARLRAVLPDASVSERAEYATALAASGDPGRAACILEAIAADAPLDESVAFLGAAARLRAGLN